VASLLVGCEIEPQSQTSVIVPRVAKRPSVTAATYLQQAKYASDDQKVTLFLKAASAALADGSPRQAEKILARVAEQPLSDQEKARLALLQAEWELANNQPAAAKALLLQNVSADSYGFAEERQQLLAAAYQALGERLMAIRTSADFLGEIPDEGERNQAMMNLWDWLSGESLSQLQQWALQVPRDSVVAGWLSLAIIMHQDEVASLKWNADLAKWRAQYPSHMASALIPKAITGPSLAHEQPERIALLLPLTGPYAQQGEAVRRGFYAAYFEKHDKINESVAALKVYDTNEVPMATLLERIRAEQMTTIVGPLLKPNVKALMEQIPSEMRVLTLNSVGQSASNVVQFSLSPESKIDELAAGMAAAKRWRIAVLVSDNAMGSRLLERFRSDWNQYRGDTVGVFRYGKQADYAAGIQALLNIDQANARHKELQSVLNKKLRFIVNRRQDIDAVLLIGDREAAQSLKPLLNFYFAEDLPVYTTSQLIDNPNDKHVASDLNGVVCLATPWQAMPMASIPPSLGEIRAQLQQTWPSSTRKNADFYAMGIDAYFILERLSVLQNMPNFSYLGETGFLSVDANHRIYPRLLWVKLSQNKVILSDRNAP
jgi:outer membrane PBP1 activator LpoA protein